jgi:transcriptional regulator with XRE-family HTH domain
MSTATSALGLTQQQLAELIGVTYQQVHKYEKGTNRVSVGRLFDVARALYTTVPELLEDLDPAKPVKMPAGGRHKIALARNFDRLTVTTQRALAAFVAAVASEERA